MGVVDIASLNDIEGAKKPDGERFSQNSFLDDDGRIETFAVLNESFKPRNEYCNCYSDGCYVYNYKAEYNTSNVWVETKRHYVFISDCLFNRGYYNMDPAGSLMWLNDYLPRTTAGATNKNIVYYKYAMDIIEAVQFVMLQEYYFFRGASNEEIAASYAKRTMIEIRKQKFFNAGKFESISYSQPPANVSIRDVMQCVTHYGTPPDPRHLPYGIE